MAETSCLRLNSSIPTKLKKGWKRELFVECNKVKGENGSGNCMVFVMDIQPNGDVVNAPHFAQKFDAVNLALKSDDGRHSYKKSPETRASAQEWWNKMKPKNRMEHLDDWAEDADEFGIDDVAVMKKFAYMRYKDLPENFKPTIDATFDNLKAGST